MAIRDFVDARGVEWRAWDITPEQMHPVTAREMFHGELADFQEGWLVFESASERRRLAPIPRGWDTADADALEAILARATPVPLRKSAETTSGSFKRYEEERSAPAVDRRSSEPSTPTGDAPRAPGGRTFTGASGRAWVVGLVERAGDVAEEERRVLRFTSDDGAMCDLHPFPDDWARLPREGLTALLRRAVPSPDRPSSSAPRRRRSDFEP